MQPVLSCLESVDPRIPARHDDLPGLYMLIHHRLHWTVLVHDDGVWRLGGLQDADHHVEVRRKIVGVAANGAQPVQAHERQTRHEEQLLRLTALLVRVQIWQHIYVIKARDATQDTAPLLPWSGFQNPELPCVASRKIKIQHAAMRPQERPRDGYATRGNANPVWKILWTARGVCPE